MKLTERELLLVLAAVDDAQGKAFDGAALEVFDPDDVEDEPPATYAELRDLKLKFEAAARKALAKRRRKLGPG